jgi:gamma-glutamylcyclotransferase (GGCT)/AIG2-like uncharacterized protein YtfP
MSAADDRGGVAVFTYGSLMYDAVWGALVPAACRSLPARIPGWRRHAIRGATYPGIVAAPGAAVDGRLWLDVSAADLARLDAFEGPEYRRETVWAHPADGSAPRAAQAWVWLDDALRLDHDWDARVFERDHLADFARLNGAGAATPPPG